LSIEGLIDPLLQLLFYWAQKLMVLNNRSTIVESYDPQLSEVGALAREAGVTASAGFSPSHWRFWTSRIAEMRKCDIESIFEYAEAFLRIMWSDEETAVGHWVGERSTATDGRV